MFVVIEGGDCCGKDTQANLLAVALKAARIGFPNYNSPTGQAILGHLKSEWICAQKELEDEYLRWGPASGTLDALTFQCLQAANRLEMLPQIRKTLSEASVVSARYWQSAVVYGALDGLDPEWLSLIQEQPMPAADINILLDMPVQMSFERKPEKRDRYEADRGFLEKVRTAYLRLFSDRLTEPGCVNKPQWRIVDAAHSVEEVHKRIMDIVQGGK